MILEHLDPQGSIPFHHRTAVTGKRLDMHGKTLKRADVKCRDPSFMMSLHHTMPGPGKYLPGLQS